jgi:hypothetical protein
MPEQFSSADIALARRIESGHAHTAIVSTQDLSIEQIGGGWAIFHHPDSPVTQAIGVGMNGDVARSELDRLEGFFHSRRSAAIIDLCTLAHPNLWGLVQERGYLVREISHVMARRLDPSENFGALAAGIAVEPVGSGEFPSWARLMLQGFAEQDDIPEEQVAVLSVSPWPEAFFGLSEASPAATGAMDVHAGLATFVGDATPVRARGRGLQLALIRHRLQRAAQLGCDLASASVLPGGSSNRNYQRAGFQLVYARIKVARAL